jgi:hypothetical protein
MESYEYKQIITPCPGWMTAIIDGAVGAQDSMILVDLISSSSYPGALHM